MENREFIEEWVRRGGYEKVTKFYGKNPRAVIFGESHMNQNHALWQLRFLEELKSGILIHELARNFIIDLNGKRIYENPDYLISQEVQRFAKRETRKGEIIVGFLDDEFKKWLEENEITNLLNKYEGSYLALEFNEDASLGAILRRLPFSMKQVIGCDVSFAEFHFYEERNRIELSSRLCPKKHHAFREKKFAEVIGEYALPQNELVVAVMGAYHIKRYSKIHRELEQRGIDYACVDQTADIN